MNFAVNVERLYREGALTFPRAAEVYAFAAIDLHSGRASVDAAFGSSSIKSNWVDLCDFVQDKIIVASYTNLDKAGTALRKMAWHFSETDAEAGRRISAEAKELDAARGTDSGPPDGIPHVPTHDDRVRREPLPDSESDDEGHPTDAEIRSWARQVRQAAYECAKDEVFHQRPGAGPGFSPGVKLSDYDEVLEYFKPFTEPDPKPAEQLASRMKAALNTLDSTELEDIGSQDYEEWEGDARDSFVQGVVNPYSHGRIVERQRAAVAELLGSARSRAALARGVRKDAVAAAKQAIDALDGLVVARAITGPALTLNVIGAVGNVLNATKEGLDKPLALLAASKDIKGSFEESERKLTGVDTRQLLGDLKRALNAIRREMEKQDQEIAAHLAASKNSIWKQAFKSGASSDLKAYVPNEINADGPDVSDGKDLKGDISEFQPVDDS